MVPLIGDVGFVRTVGSNDAQIVMLPVQTNVEREVVEFGSLIALGIEAPIASALLNTVAIIIVLCLRRLEANPLVANAWADIELLNIDVVLSLSVDHVRIFLVEAKGSLLNFQRASGVVGQEVQVGYLSIQCQVAALVPTVADGHILVAQRRGGIVGFLPTTIEVEANAVRRGEGQIAVEAHVAARELWFLKLVVDIVVVDTSILQFVESRLLVVARHGIEFGRLLNSDALTTRDIENLTTGKGGLEIGFRDIVFFGEQGVGIVDHIDIALGQEGQKVVLALTGLEVARETKS